MIRTALAAAASFATTTLPAFAQTTAAAQAPAS